MEIFSKNKKNKSKKNWLSNHKNDFYVKKAKENNYRSRASYKLLEIDNKYKIIGNNQKILDVGCSPGGWCQVLNQKNNYIWGIDILPMKPIEKTHFNLMDITINEGENFKNFYNDLLGNRPFDLIVSDAACNTTGHCATDHFRTTYLNCLVINHINNLLKFQGSLVFKTFNGAETPDMIKRLKILFKKVHTFKPLSSKPESKEIYIIALFLKI